MVAVASLTELIVVVVVGGGRGGDRWLSWWWCAASMMVVASPWPPSISIALSSASCDSKVKATDLMEGFKN